MSNKNIGLIMEGGGVKGAYQVGALKALEEAGVSFDGIAGTSIGAINGALLLQGGYTLLEDIWDNVKFSTVFDISEEMADRIKNRDFGKDIFFYAGKKLVSLREVIRASYEMSSEFLTKNLSEDVLRKSPIDYGFVTYNISDMLPVEVMKEDVEEGKLIDFIIASATFPIFPPKVIDNKKYTDGGVYDNMPINLLANHGYDKLLVLRTNNFSMLPKRRQSRDDLEIMYVAPNKDLGNPMFFTAERIAGHRNLGYHDCKKALSEGLDKFLS